VDVQGVAAVDNLACARHRHAALTSVPPAGGDVEVPRLRLRWLAIYPKKDRDPPV